MKVITYNGQFEVIQSWVRANTGMTDWDPTQASDFLSEALIGALENSGLGVWDGSCTMFTISGDAELESSLFITEVSEPFRVQEDHYNSGDEDFGSASSIMYQEDYSWYDPNTGAVIE